MNDTLPEPSANGMTQTLAELERRVLALEEKVAALPDTKQIEERVTLNVKASLPPPPPPIDPMMPPSFKDIEIPMPSVQTVVETAKVTWGFLEMLNELRMLFWTLFDRRYHMAWLTRFVAIALVAMVMTSDYWFPLATYDNLPSRLWDKVVNLLFCLILFLVLSFETRRYKAWRGKV
jgi:hypothetical protein